MCCCNFRTCCCGAHSLRNGLALFAIAHSLFIALFIFISKSAYGYVDFGINFYHLCIELIYMNCVVLLGSLYEIKGMMTFSLVIKMLQLIAMFFYSIAFLAFGISGDLAEDAGICSSETISFLGFEVSITGGGLKGNCDAVQVYGIFFALALLAMAGLEIYYWVTMFNFRSGLFDDVVASTPMPQSPFGMLPGQERLNRKRKIESSPTISRWQR